MLGDRIKILHVHNNNKQCDWHVAPSIGKVEWNGAVDTLKEIGYSGPLTLEINLTLVPDERTDSYIKYLGEDAEWLEKKFNS